MHKRFALTHQKFRLEGVGVGFTQEELYSVGLNQGRQTINNFRQYARRQNGQAYSTTLRR